MPSFEGDCTSERQGRVRIDKVDARMIVFEGVAGKWLRVYKPANE